MQLNLAFVARKGTGVALAKLAALIGVVAAVVFLSHPSLDLDVARLFVPGDGRFVGKSGGTAAFVRDLFKAVYLLTLIAAMTTLVVSLCRSSRRSLSSSSIFAIYFALCLTIGPGLVANVVLKEHSRRARPSQTAEFGAMPFSAVLVPSNNCPRNCSFISGEASSMFVIFFAAAPIVPQWSAVLIVAGTVLGLAAGLVRTAQGGHFLSDVIFAGVLMALVVSAIHWAVFARRASRTISLKLTTAIPMKP